MCSVTENNTLQEMWHVETDSGSQWSHCPLAPIYVLYQDIAGIRPLAPGFARLQFRPQFGDLPDLYLIAHTPRGPVTFRSTREGKGHRIDVTMPADCEAELHLPPGVKSEFPVAASDGALLVKKYKLPTGGARFVVADSK